MTTSRADALLEVIRQGIFVSGERQKSATLGDRTTYVGMSDIGRYVDCPRAALAEKLLPQDFTLDRLLPMQRGHWFEEGIGQCLVDLGLHVLPQLEIRHTFEGVPIRAHLDLTLVWDRPRPAVRILEIKSMGQIPTNPYAAHELQVQGQTSLLHALWEKTAFSVSAGNGRKQHQGMSLRELCTSEFNIDMPASPKDVSIEGWLLCLSMKDAQAFGPYSFDADVLEQVQDTARDFWQHLQELQDGSLSLDSIPHAQGFHPLCGACPFNAYCPKFPQGDFQPQWEPAICKLDDLKQQRSALESEIKEVEQALKQAYSLSDTQDWISTGQHRFRLSSTAGRRTLDEASLQKEVDEICASMGIDQIDVNGLLRRHEHEGVPSTRLTISHFNTAEAFPNKMG